MIKMLIQVICVIIISFLLCVILMVLASLEFFKDWLILVRVLFGLIIMIGIFVVLSYKLGMRYGEQALVVLEYAYIFLGVLGLLAAFELDITLLTNKTILMNQQWLQAKQRLATDLNTLLESCLHKQSEMDKNVCKWAMQVSIVVREDQDRDKLLLATKDTYGLEQETSDSRGVIKHDSPDIVKKMFYKLIDYEDLKKQNMEMQQGGGELQKLFEPLGPGFKYLGYWLTAAAVAIKITYTTMKYKEWYKSK